MKTLSKNQWLTIADGIAHGRSFLDIAGAVGADRSLLRQWFARDGMPEELARRIGSPDALDADALAVLFDSRALSGEREKNRVLRLAFADAVRTAYPEWFDARKREEDEAETERKRRDESVKRETEAEIVREEAEHERMLDCLRADFWNLQTLVELHQREWRDGTPGELKRGLYTPEARRQYRCAKGLRWTCAGFGWYFEPRRSACLCRMQYALDEAAGDRLTAFYEIANKVEYSRAWDEIEYEADAGLIANPFARRDPKLPTSEAAARALLEHVKAGGAFVGWKWNKPRKAANRKGDR